jgi:Right handed beta helix region
MKSISGTSRLVISAAIGGCLVLACAVGFKVLAHSATSTYTAGLSSTGMSVSAAQAASIPASTNKVCGQSILRSPFNYHGKAGGYRSGARGLPTYGRKGTSFPHAKSGVILPVGTHDYPSYKLQPNTVYYLLPGTHIGSIQADANDAFVGGYWKGKGTVLTGNYVSGGQAIDSNETLGNQHGVTIEYLTIEKYQPDANAAAVNQDANSQWNIRYNTITLNVPGAGVMLGTADVLHANCLTRNGQYGFQSQDTNGWDEDSLTGGPYGIMVSGNEISYNDTCDFSGLLNNSAIGWVKHNPVPPQYRNSKCGTVVGDGDQGGFKLWKTNGVTISGNYIHNNWGPGGWADTNNANTTWTGNTITGNESEGITEEISYNFGIRNNYIANNDWADGLNNPGFPQAAIYISESGSDTSFGGVPGCKEVGCIGQEAYVRQSVISGNQLVNNGGNIFLWQSSNRHCSDGFDGPCTLVDGGRKGPFTINNCSANLSSAAVSTTTFVGTKTGSPAEDWWDGCLWRTENIAITGNTIDFNPAHIPHCNSTAWRDCGVGGIFSQYGSPTASYPSWVIPTQLTFFQHNVWSHNTYNGPSPIVAWNQGNGDNPVTWAEWTGKASSGDKCTSASERQSGYCTGPFGQDSGSTYHPAPVS